MAEWGRLGKSNPLSASLPDVSSPPYRQSSFFRASQLSPLPDTPFLPGATKSPNTNYHIEDDAWADKADPVTGSVFYIEPSIPSNVSLVPSSSSSSLSSSPPMSEFIPPPSPTAAHYGLASLPDRDRSFSSSVQLPESPASGSFHHEKPRSLRKKLHKMMNVSGAKRAGGVDNDDLNQSHGDFTSGVRVDMSHQIPQGSQYGSHGTPLHTHASSSLVGYQTKVDLDLSQFQLGAEGVSCSLEKLGIVPTRSLSRWKFGSLVSLRLSSFKTHYPPPSPSASQPVVVRALVPGYPAAAATPLKPGDTILSVNQHAVNMDNIDSVLATLSNKLHFLIKKGHSRLSSCSSSISLLSPPPPPSPHMSSSGGLVRLVTGGKGGMAGLGPRKQQGHFHLLLYITLDTKEDDPPEKDILYRYPRLSEDEGGGGVVETQEKLVRLRGAFLTLSDVLATITGSPSISNSSVLLDGKLVHVSCTQTGKELLLITFPKELATQYQLQLFLETVDKTLSLMFGSIHDAFTTLSCQSSVDHILGLLFDTILSQCSPPPGSPHAPASSPLTPSSPLLGVPALPRLKLPTDITMKLDAVLSGLESCDHSGRPEMLHIRRPYLLVGSCLVHRGALACSHLSSEQQRGVALFCHAYRLLELTASEIVSQIVIWKEVFLSPPLTAHQGHQGHQVHQGHQGHQSEQRKREFLLAIGLEQTLLCMLMQQVSAPSASLPDANLSPSVDAVYVDRGRALLLELRTQDLLNQESLEASPLPTLASADSAIHSLFRRSSRQLVTSVSQRGNLAPGKGRKLSDPFGIISRNSIDDGSDSEEEGVVVVGRANRRRSQSMLSLKPQFRQRKAAHTKGSSSGSGELAGKKSIVAPRPPYTLTSGHDNLLLHYVDLEAGRGLMVCPTHSTPPGCIQSELLKSFQLSCSVVRKVLRGGRVEGEDGTESQSESDSDDWDGEEEEGAKEEVAARPFVPKASSVMEHGVLWECGTRSLKTVATMRYWVIGRYYLETDRELYICCQENISQSTVEMAFRLLFGWPR